MKKCDIFNEIVFEINENVLVTYNNYLQNIHL